MIEFRLWRSFVVLAEELSFRRAASRLNISQPALTKQIQELETRLGVALFRRESRGVEATEATLACLDAVRALLDQADAVEAQFTASQQSAESKITVGMLEFFSRASLPGIFQQVRNAFPDVRISIVEMNTFETAAAAADGRIDIGIARAPVSEQNVVARPYRRGHWTLIMPDNHRLAEKTEIALADLDGEPLIFFLRRLNPELYDGIISAVAEGGRKVEVAYHAQDPMVGAELALSGIGLCLAVSYAIQELPAGLVSRPVAGLGFEPMLDLVWRRDHMTPALRMLIDAMLKPE
ncbi:LysR family transcriptional regulator [Hyphococcus sp.]|uniref:LysR family transcriptional regulator n=1 Tax=Hyphococcus sp. TaxID=2038636 RepID=UPI003D122223